jgi:hypothetical protein
MHGIPDFLAGSYQKYVDPWFFHSDPGFFAGSTFFHAAKKPGIHQ